MELGVPVTFVTGDEALSQKQLTSLMCSKEGWEGILEWPSQFTSVMNTNRKMNSRPPHAVKFVVHG